MASVREVGWHEDPEHPGLLTPDEPITLTSGDTFTLTTTVIDGVTLPWAEGTVTTQEGSDG